MTSAYARPPARTDWWRGRGVPRQPDRGWRMPSSLGGRSLRAFGQPAFFLAGNCMPTVAFDREVIFYSLAYLAKRYSSTEVKFRTREKYQISINGKKKFKRILSCVFGGRQKVQVTKFAFEGSSLLPVLLRTGSPYACVCSILQRSRRQI